MLWILVLLGSKLSYITFSFLIKYKPSWTKSQSAHMPDPIASHITLEQFQLMSNQD